MCASDQRWKVAARWRGLMRAASLAALMGCALVAHAQSDREQEQLKRLKLQLRQLQQEQSTAQEAQSKADQARQQAEQALKATQGQLQGAKAASGNTSRQVSTLTQELTAIKDERTRMQAQLEQLTRQVAEQGQALQAATVRGQEFEAKLRQAVTANGNLGASVKQLTAQNAQLHQLGTELLQRYDNKGLSEVLGGAEPFVQSARVALENLKETYQDKLDAARAKPVVQAEPVR
jgi:chromosome segregation ATPase